MNQLGVDSLVNREREVYADFLPETMSLPVRLPVGR